MTVSKDIFGTLTPEAAGVRGKRGEGSGAGIPIERYTLENSGGTRVQVMTYGACITSVQVPGRDGRAAEVALNFGSLEGYIGKHPFFGMTVGRFANRIGGAKFVLDGRTYSLAANNGRNHLHGGTRGFDKYVWSAEAFGNPTDVGVRLTRTSDGGEEGYPGTLQVAVIMTLTEENELILDYEAQSDRATPVNLTNHSYWNLSGTTGSSVLDHELRIAADRYVVVDDEAIPTGSIAPVDGPMDFRALKPVGRDIASVPGGYDHCYVVAAGGTAEDAAAAKSAGNGNGKSLGGEMRNIAEVIHRPSGRRMELLTTMPGVQLYTGNKLDGVAAAGGNTHKAHDALCLETEYFPDSVNQPTFFAPILRPGGSYVHRTVYRFSVTN